MANQQTLNRIGGGFNVKQRIADTRNAELQNLLSQQMKQGQVQGQGLQNQIRQMQIEASQKPQGPQFKTQGGYQYQVGPNGEVIGSATVIPGLPQGSAQQPLNPAQAKFAEFLPTSVDPRQATPEQWQQAVQSQQASVAKPRSGAAVKPNTDLAQFLPADIQKQYFSGTLNDSAMYNIESMAKRLKAKSETDAVAAEKALSEKGDSKLTDRQNNMANTKTKAFSEAATRAFSVLTDPFKSPTTGVAGQVMGLKAGSSRKKLVGAITTMNANISFETLNAMRKASKTGGALGSVSAPELDMLKASLASIDPDGADSDEDLMRQIAAAEKLFNEIVHGPEYATPKREAYTRPSIEQAAASMGSSDEWEIL